MASTPPRQIHRPQTPPTPRYGVRDELLSPVGPRRVTRSAVKQAKTAASQTSSQTLSPPLSSPPPEPSPPRTRSRKPVQKRLTFADEESSDHEGNERGTLLNPGGLGLPTPSKTPSRKRKTPFASGESAGKILFPSTSAAAGTLPTPTKTPAKTPAKRDAFGHVRTMTAKEKEVLSTPSKRRAARLDMIGEHGKEEDIDIFTDADARMPAVDENPENPFVCKTPAKRRGGAKVPKAPKASSYEEATAEEFKRDDGMVYMYRGKKIFKKFSEVHGRSRSPLPGDDETGEDFAEDSPMHPKNIKPRLLFHSTRSRTNKKENGQHSAEEAETDIDDHNRAGPSTSTRRSVHIATAAEEADTDVDAPAVKTTTTRRTTRVTRRNMTPDSEDEVECKPAVRSLFAQGAAPMTPKKTPAKKRGAPVPATRGRAGAKVLFKDDEEVFETPAEEDEIVVEEPVGRRGVKRGSVDAGMPKQQEGGRKKTKGKAAVKA